MHSSRSAHIVEIDADERIAAIVVVRPRRHRRRLRGARRPVPRRRSGRPRAHMVGHHAGYAALNRREVPATTPDWVRSTIGRWHHSSRVIWPHTSVPLGDLTPDITHLHRGCASAERPRRGRHPRGAWDLARGLRRRVADDRRPHRRRRSDQPRRAVRRGGPRRRARPFDELSRPAPRLENAASQTFDRFDAYLAARDWDAMAEMIADDVFHDDRRRVVSAGSNWVEMPRSQTCELSSTSGLRTSSRSSSRSAGIASRSPVPAYQVATSGPRHSSSSCSNIVEIDADNRIAALFSSTSTTSTPPSRNSTPGTSQAKRPSTHIHGRSSPGLRRVQSARTPGDNAGMDEHRPPARNLGRTRRSDCALARAAWEVTPDIRYRIEVRASVEQRRCGGHSRVKWDVTTGL